MAANEKYRVPEKTRIGHVHLKVSDLERALSFYNGILGFEVTQRIGDSAAFLSAGGYHHHIGLNTWHSKGAPEAVKSGVGLYHTAIVYETRKELAEVLQRLLNAEYPLTGAADHGVSEALYLNDPDGNGVELYYDRPKEEWPRKRDGSLEMFSKALHLDKLLAELQ
ncbi:VOC family protein [Salinimicrobium sp. TH3]|uniref:VOC family protein n=1 Tax=Salinimicrobium sp. TH3 TaxID=2997342 RepID=UPI002273AEFE|nr:VOC family protein [Salinimicrobium sp. TH3]MCY2686732.1 VOC family protein [Salinimicrobium sp. TH3]